MKKIIGLLALIVLASCNKTPEGYRIEGNLRGDIKDSTSIFLKYLNPETRQPVNLDTTLIINGQFEFNGKSTDISMHYLTIEGTLSNLPIILEDGIITLNAHKDSLGYLQLAGTLQNEVFMNYLDRTRSMAAISRELNDEYRIASTKRDTAQLKALQEEFIELRDKNQQEEKRFVLEHPDALISVLLVDKFLATRQLTTKEVDSIFKVLTPEMQNTVDGKRVRKSIDDLIATAIGSPAPKFSGPTPTGENLALESIQGKVTLIDFWAAWCRPCRAENPNIVAVYNKYKEKGLSVIGVSLDKNKEEWEKAILEDGLTWNHVSNLQRFDDPIAKLYQINAIPAAFLLDENGVIIAKDLRGENLEKKIAELLGD